MTRDVSIETVWRMESARLIAGLTRAVRDIGLAEECAQEALVAALEQWPRLGVPDNPGAWLMTVAKRRAIDQIRRDQRYADRLALLASAQATSTEPDLAASVDDDIDDDLLRLVFTACHPCLSSDARVALTLKVLGGLTTGEIARAFLVSESTVAQRIVRAKRDARRRRRCRSRCRRRHNAPPASPQCWRSSTSSSTKGTRRRPGRTGLGRSLAEEALRLGRVLAGLIPGEPEVHGLVALMELQASRLRARVDARRGTGAASGPGPIPVGPAAHPSWPGRLATCRGA